jgi:hypothetical protein
MGQFNYEKDSSAKQKMIEQWDIYQHKYHDYRYQKGESGKEVMKPLPMKVLLDLMFLIPWKTKLRVICKI